MNVNNLLRKVQAPGLTIGLAIASIAALGSFPFLGNMVTYPHFSDFRRYVQLMILASSLALLGWVVLRSCPTPVRSLVAFAKKSLCVFLSTFGFLLLFLVLFSDWRSAGLQQWFEVIAVSAIISSLWIALGVGASSKPPRPVSYSSLSLLPIFLVGSYASVAAWWFGPVPLEALVNFQGSTIFVAAGACIGFFCILFLSPNFWTWLLALPFLFIVVVSTARSAVPIMVYFSFALGVRAAFLTRGSWGWKGLRFAGVSLVPIVLYLSLILSTFMGDRFYPYQAASKSSEEILYRNAEFFCRYTRILRLVNVGGYSMVDLLPGNPESYEKYVSEFVGRKGLEGLNASLEGKDDRYELWFQSYKAISQRWQGHWPRLFSEKVQVKCDRFNFCAYPHNLILDMAFKFGWFFGILVFILVAVLTLKLTWLLIRSADLLAICFAIVILTQFMVSQISGTFGELANLPILLLLFSFYRTYAQPIVAREPSAKGSVS